MSHNLELWYVVIGAFSFFEQFVDTREIKILKF